MSTVILNAGTIPKDYMFPGDWVKKQDWAAIKKQYGGTTLEVVFEGTDIGAPLATKQQFEDLTGMKLVFRRAHRRPDGSSSPRRSGFRHHGRQTPSSVSSGSRATDT
jgi:hypothetical protein